MNAQRIRLTSTTRRRRPDAVDVARGTPWGNPFDWRAYGIQCAVDAHAAWLAGDGGPDIRHDPQGRAYSRADVLDNLDQLAGLALACPCPTNRPCHADTLARLAARGHSGPPRREGVMSRPAARLTPAQVVEIREQIAAGARNDDLAALYGVSVETIRKIRYGRTWTALERPPRTHCRNHHSYAEHGYVNARGKRRCRQCRREHERGSRLTREEYIEEHDGHELRTRVDGSVYCLSCWRGESYIDGIAVERAAAGEPPERMTVAERHAAIRLLDGTGPSAREIAKRLGICSRTVERHRALIRKAAA